MGYLFHALLSVFMVPLKKKVGSEERKKKKRREMSTEEKEKDGWNE